MTGNLAAENPGAKWTRAFSFKVNQGSIKQLPEDFRVTEVLPESASGEGEHLWLTLEKTGQNTSWVAKQLAQWGGVRPRDVSYAGLKDRHAVTQQTFSIQYPGKSSPDINSLEIDGVSLISQQRHIRKLKTGHLIGNKFEIRIRDYKGSIEELKSHWDDICKFGIPNYVGPQRFGIRGQNINEGIAWLRGDKKAPRHLQSIYLSAVRSYLFNLLLDERVKNKSWNQIIDGDFVQFTEGKTGFYCLKAEQHDIERLESGKLSPCASLPGVERDSFDLLSARETQVLAPYADIIELLKEKKVARHFRKLRLFPEQANFETVDHDPILSFFLPAGAFATTVLSEIIDWQGQITSNADWNE